MPMYRLEVRTNRTWHIIAALQSETTEAAITKIREILPRRCEGHLVRAIELRARTSRCTAARAAGMEHG
jgi:hypothetical protein